MKGCELEVCHAAGKTDHLSGLKLYDLFLHYVVVVVVYN